MIVVQRFGFDRRLAHFPRYELMAATAHAKEGATTSYRCEDEFLVQHPLARLETVTPSTTRS